MKEQISSDNPHLHISVRDQQRIQLATSILSATTAEWESNSHIISKKNRLYVYTDYFTDEDGVVHPGLKIGDGKAYISDLPMINSGVSTGQLMQHLNDNIRHITQEERVAWNSKLKCTVDEAAELLTFNA